MGKYQPLEAHLKAIKGPRYTMTFEEIEALLGEPLPPSAYRHRAWWSNNPSNSVITYAWLNAGWKSTDVDMEGKKLVFRRTRDDHQSVPRDVRLAESSGTTTDHTTVAIALDQPTLHILKVRSELAGTSIADAAREILYRHAALTAEERLAAADRIRAKSPDLRDVDMVKLFREDREAR